MHARVVAHNVRHESYDVFLNDLQIGFLLVGIGGDLNGSIPIDSLDTGKTTSFLNIGNRGKGYFLTIGSSNAHGFQICQGSAFFLGVTHHDANIFAASLDTLSFASKESLAGLASQIGHGQAQQFSFWLDAHFSLGLAVLEGILDVKEVRVLSQLFLGLFGSQFEVIKAWSCQLNSDRITGSTNLCPKAEFLCAGNDADGSAPLRDDLLAGQGQLSGFRWRYAHGDFTHVGEPGGSSSAAGHARNPDDIHDVLNDTLSRGGFGVVFALLEFVGLGQDVIDVSLCGL